MTPDMRAEIRRLVLGEQWHVETVARRLHIHHSTVKRALADEETQPTGPGPSTLDPFKPYLVERIQRYPELTAPRLHREIAQLGFAHGVAVVRRFLAQLRPPRQRKAYLRVEFVPGEQAQVDWGSFGQMRIGHTLRPLSCFVMVLSWSRALYLDFSLDQQMETFLRMHRRALDFLGGVPRRIVYDNLKSVVLHHIGSTVQFNPRFLGFAGHYLFEPTAAPVRYPEFKGRVEALMRYIRHAFFYGRSFSSVEDLRAQAARWRDEVANTRIHATTRERPCDRLLVERVHLRKPPERPYDTDLVLACVATKEARVRLDANTYSVPHTTVGKTVHLRADDHTVRVFDGQTCIATHNRSWDRRVAVEDPSHVQRLLERRRAAQPSKRRDQIADLAPECRLYLQEVARRRIDLDSEVRKLLRLTDRYGKTEVAGAIAKALAQRSIGARYVHALCDQARFARGLGEPPEPIVTGNPLADDLTVEPHDLETYDALAKAPQVPAALRASDDADRDPDPSASTA
jgi:transposase